MKTFLLLILISTLGFAIEIGQDVELKEYMNARYSADFTKAAKNVKGVLAKGTKGKVKEVRTFASGNSGFLIDVQDGPMKSEKVWVYYNKEKPTIDLVDASAQPTTNTDNAATTVTTAPTPVIREPDAGPGVALSDADRAVTDLGTINRNATTSDCTTCNPQAENSGRMVSSADAAGLITAKMRCSYQGKYGALPGKIDIEIANNNVTKLNVQIDGCNVTLAEFHQVHFDNNNNIVLKNAEGCAVVIGRYNRTVEGQPVLSYGMVPTQDCVKFCSRVERKFWQAEMNPNTQSCY